MSTGELTYCFTPDGETVRIGHYGPHQVGLGVVFRRSNPVFNGRWVLERAIAVAEEAGDSSLDRLRPLLTRAEVTPYFVEVTYEEVVALRRLLSGAQDYWVSEKFASHDQDGDQLLGQLAEAGVVVALGLCLDLKPIVMP